MTLLVTCNEFVLVLHCVNQYHCYQLISFIWQFNILKEFLNKDIKVLFCACYVSRYQYSFVQLLSLITYVSEFQNCYDLQCSKQNLTT